MSEVACSLDLQQHACTFELNINLIAVGVFDAVVFSKQKSKSVSVHYMACLPTSTRADPCMMYQKVISKHTTPTLREVRLHACILTERHLKRYDYRGTKL